MKKEEYRHRARSGNARVRGRYINGEGMRRGERKRESPRKRSRARPIAVSRGSVVDETVVARRNLSLLAYVETRLLSDTGKIELTIVEDNTGGPIDRRHCARSNLALFTLSLSFSLPLRCGYVRVYVRTCPRVRAWSGSEHAKSRLDRADIRRTDRQTDRQMDARTYDTHARSDTKLSH